jgi:hypothetical protein
MHDMRRFCRRFTPPFVLIAIAILAVSGGLSPARAGESLPDGYMGERESREILDKTLVITLAPDLSGLSEGERAAVDKLIVVGQIFQKLYESMRHHQAITAYAGLLALDEQLGSPPATKNLIDMYYMFKGPVARMLDNKSRTFLPVDPKTAGRNVYPWGIKKDEIEAFLSEYPESRPWLLGVRSVVRRSERANVDADLATLDAHPVLDVLHPGFRDLLESLRGDPGDKAFYACPYSVAFAEPLMQSYIHLNEAADLVDQDDPEFADYLRNRARDLLSDDYESGDASWVTGRFRNLNAQIGSYEVYDDQLYGVKSFFGFNVLLRDKEQSDALGKAIRGMQAFENSLPYEPVGWDGRGDKKKIREDIPVGVYHVVADFGQSRGTNTATILPNESAYARKYGRTILIRYNIINHPEFFAVRRDAFQAAVARDHADDLTPEGGFYRTLWHEIGHYLGVDRTSDGRELGEALEAASSKLEELKADLVSLYLVPALLQQGYYTDETARSVYADGVRRVLLKNKPSLTQTYRTMQLMQFNYYLENGLFEFDGTVNRLRVHYDRYHDVVEVLALQQNGDREAANAFIDRYFVWNDEIHGVLADAMTRTEKYRYGMVRYAILESR